MKFEVVVHCGAVFAYRMYSAGYRNIRAFPEALTKKGDPDTSHPSVLKYIKDFS